MQSQKIKFFNQFSTTHLLGLLSLFCFLLLAIRMLITGKLFYGFLVWNLILAFVPYCITLYLKNKVNHNNIVLILGFGVWILFLPNAPYLITDFVHLKLSPFNVIYLDILMVFSFALNGLAFYYSSFNDMLFLITPFLNKKLKPVVIAFLLFLTSFGIYLGRFLRYNSWELITNPKILIKDILLMLKFPIEYSHVWSFTFYFGLFLTFGYVCLFYALKLKKINS